MGFGKDLIVGISLPHGTAKHSRNLAGSGSGKGKTCAKSPSDNQAPVAYLMVGLFLTSLGLLVSSWTTGEGFGHRQAKRFASRPVFIITVGWGL